MKPLEKTIQCMLVMLVLASVICGSVWGVTEEEISKIKSAMPDKAVVRPEQDRKILVFSLCKGFAHECIPYWIEALDAMAGKTGAFSVEHSTDMNVFTAEKLKEYDAICFNNTTTLVPNEEQKKAILDFIRGGKGIIGIHAATDNFNDWPEGQEMMGGNFTGHPWTSNGTWAVKLDEPDHPLLKSFEGKNFVINDEIYRTAAPLYSREKQRVLVSLNMSDAETKNARGVREDDMDTGISWIKPVGKGRLFYCSLGHNNHLTWNTAVLGHYLAGIQYALGDLVVDDDPVSELSVALDTDQLNALIDGLKKYDWDQDRSGLIKLNDFIRQQYEAGKNLKQIESALLAVLNSDVSVAAKDFICRQLTTIGSDASVSTLLSMLDDKETASMARYAMERIPSSAVDAGLLKKLASVKDEETKIGIISTLRHRKSQNAVDSLSTLAGHAGSIGDAAIQALGSIGTKAAAEALNKLAVSDRVDDALLVCVTEMIQQGEKAAAIDICKKLYSSRKSPIVRRGALIGLMDAGGDSQIFMEAITDNDARIQAAAASKIAAIDDTDIINNILSNMSSMPDSLKIQVFAGLAENKRKVGGPQIEQILSQTENADVRMAGYKALAVLGNAKTAITLATFASKAADRDEKAAAQEALYTLQGEDVNGAVLRAIAGNADLDEAIKIELIQATAGRPIPGACDLLLTTARSESRRISAESMKALQQLATGECMEGLVTLLLEKPSSAMENAVVATAGRMNEDKSKLLVAKYSTAKDEQAKVSLLKVIGMIGDPGSSELLKKEFGSSDGAISEAAFRGMAEWPGGDFIDLMKTQAQSATDEKRHILALMAYVRMADLVYGATDMTKAVDSLIEAFNMAKRVDEKKLVISSLGNYPDARVVEFLSPYLDAPELRAEAEVGIVTACQQLRSRPQQVTAILEKISNTTTNETLKTNLDRMLRTGTGMRRRGGL